MDSHGNIPAFKQSSALALSGLLLFASPAKGGPVPFQPSDPLPPPTKPPIVRIAPDTFELGKVRLDKNARTISFPASVNMTEGLIEYLVVHGSGKIHESLLQTQAEPYHVHLAMLLLSDTPVPDTKPETEPSGARANPEQDVTIWVAWNQHAKETRVRAEDLVLDVETKTAMKRGPWRYIGSRVVDGTFLAQRDGSMIAVIDDPDALVKNTRPGSDNDENWQIRSDPLPDFGTPVTLILQLEKR